MTLPVRPAILGMSPTRPPAFSDELRRRLGDRPLVRLSSNEGAFGPLEPAADAYARAVLELNRYPDCDGRLLREALAERHQVAVDQVVLGNGADELIRLCAVCVVEQGDRVVFPWPSFPSYRDSARCCGGVAVEVPLCGTGVDAAALLDAIDGDGGPGAAARLVYLANPNNPTGSVMAPDELDALVGAVPRSVLCVLDEAYAEYADAEPGGIDFVRHGRPGICVLRTFSKVYGLASLRVGYAIASDDVASALQRARPVHNVNGPAQAAAAASLGQSAALAGRVHHVRRGRERIAAMLAEAGLLPAPSECNFVFAEVPGGDGDGLAAGLLGEGVLVRALSGFGAPAAVRVTVGTDAENDLLAEALARVAGTVPA
jgi:histidinol-phosphate aminotransferase